MNFVIFDISYIVLACLTLVIRPIDSIGWIEFIFTGFKSGLEFSSACQSKCDIFATICLLPSNLKAPLSSGPIVCPYGFYKIPSIRLNTVEQYQFRISWPIALRSHVQLYTRLNNGSRTVIGNSSKSISLSSEDSWHRISSENFDYQLRIVCAENYYGPKCDRNCIPKNNPRGHYNCSDAGRKVCSKGWQGLRCTEPVCASGCLYGKCIAPDTCSCNLGWQGDACDKCVTYDGCLNGYCKKEFECNCHDRWGGFLCDLDLDYCLHNGNPCLNGGLCVSSEPDNYTCNCPPGFRGQSCEIKPSLCTQNHCFNNGICIVTLPTAQNRRNFTCYCDSKHTGDRCQLLTHVQPRVPIEKEVIVESCKPGSRWETSDCRQCSCIQGSSQCSQSSCQPGDCLDLKNKCPFNQVCNYISNDLCLKYPCPKKFGQCIPKELMASSTKNMRRCADQKGPNIIDQCARFHIKIDKLHIARGTTMRMVCYEILMIILTKNIRHYRVDCSFSSEFYDNFIFQVDLLSLREDSSPNSLKQILTRILNSGKTNRQILDRAVTVIEGPWTEDSKSKETTDIRWIIMLTVTSICVLCFLGAAFFILNRYRKKYGGDIPEFKWNNLWGAYQQENRANAQHERCLRKHPDKSDPEKLTNIYSDCSGNKDKNEYCDKPTIAKDWHPPDYPL